MRDVSETPADLAASDFEHRAEWLMDLAAVEAELPTAKGKRRGDLLMRQAVLGRKLWPGECER